MSHDPFFVCGFLIYYFTRRDLYMASLVFNANRTRTPFPDQSNNYRGSHALWSQLIKRVKLPQKDHQLWQESSCAERCEFLGSIWRIELTFSIHSLTDRETLAKSNSVHKHYGNPRTLVSLTMDGFPANIKKVASKYTVKSK